MSKYLKTFENHSDYLTYKLSLNFIRPNVTYCKDNPNEVHYSPRLNYLTFKALEDGTFKFTGLSIKYSLNRGETWSTLASGVNSPTIISGKTIMFKANLSHLPNIGIGTFSSTANFEVKGNPMSLLYGDNFNEHDSLIGKDYAFRELFKNCTRLINAENLELSAKTLSKGCCWDMFSGCTLLETAPLLPATTLATACYQYMFYGCTALTIAPQISAVTLAPNCCTCMFQSCTSLTTGPTILPATTLSSTCYSEMFKNCTSLVVAPTLPATTLATNCYRNMFEGCIALEVAPVLPATILENGCYQEMFSGCSSLNYVKALFTAITNGFLIYRWLYQVAANGTFVKNSSATWTTTGASGVPNGWTIETASS